MMSSILSPTNCEADEAAPLQGSVFLIAADGSILRLPIPSKSPRDPLNWSGTKRSLAFLSLYFFAFVSLGVAQGGTLLQTPLADDFTTEDTRPFNLNTLLSAPTLFSGIGTFLWIPLTLVWGRRPVFLFCTFLLFVSTLGAGFSRSFPELLACVCFQGLAAGFSISSILLMIIDLTFIQERPYFIGARWSLIGAMGQVVLAIIPQMPKVTTVDWHPFYLFWSVFCAISCVLAFFMYPETYFRRPAVAFNGHVLVQSSEEKLEIYSGWEETPGGKVLPDKPQSLISGLRFWRTTGVGWRALRACYAQVLLCILNPLVFWVTLLEAVTFGSTLFIGTTYPVVLASPPYSMSTPNIALVNLAAAIGSFLAWPATTLFIPWCSNRLTIKNGGIREAEYYLPAFIMPVITGALSVILYGIIVEKQLNTRLMCIVYAFNSFSFASLATANAIWVTEAFPRWTAPAIVVLSGISFITSFSISVGILPWVRSQGYALVGIEFGLAMMAIGCIGIPVAFWGKAVRQYIHGRWVSNQEGALRPQ